MRQLLFGALLGAATLLSGPVAQAQKARSLARPKLVVGIVVDQMRYDYLYRYWNKYGADGFKRLLGQGFSFESCHYNYVPTYTGPGHASIYTGTTPSVHGIVGNNWYVREAGRSTYVTEDKTVQAVGGSAQAGQQSPRHLLTTTITDELRLATNFQGKTIGVCIKDRGSILPAGHAATAAYWFDNSNGGFITSTFYAQQLPAWVTEFNNRKLAEQYLAKPWEPLLPLAQYTESTADDVPWENTFRGEAKPVFPHDLPRLSGVATAAVKNNLQAAGEKAPSTNLDLIRTTPFGNTLTLDFALEAIRAEELGQRDATDFLALSFSSTDYVGHHFGVNAVETEDTYLRLDRDIARLLQYLDKEVGRGQSLVFLTADHGAAHSPQFLTSQRIPAAAVAPKPVQDSLERQLGRRFGAGPWVLTFDNQQVYLNRPLIAQRKLELEQVQRETARLASQLTGVSRAITAQDLERSHWESGLLMYLENGYYPKRSGDVMVVFDPGSVEAYADATNYKGTTHGSGGAYDTHVPLVFWGWRVPRGESAHPVRITDIAPTLARMLHIQEPNGCTGQPLQAVLSRKQ